MPEAIDCRDLHVRFGHVDALQGATLRVEPGEVMALLGPSGCGKTTMLRCIAGLQRADRGEVRLGDRVLQDSRTFVPPHRRGIGLVFQEHALFPHRTVAGNIGFGLPRRADSRHRVAEMLAMVGLEGMEQRYPHELSGGQQQRVAVLRSLAPHPHALLLDEPFSNLDAALRTSMRTHVAELLRAEQVTALLVTHDRADAFAVADRVAVMSNGRIEQVGRAEELYFRPATRLAAAMAGEVQYVPGVVRDGLVETPLGVMQGAGPVPAGKCGALVRPEWIVPADDGVEVTISALHLEGGTWRASITLEDGEELMMLVPGGVTLSPGRARVAVRLPVATFDATT